jgi:hypothetical protein
MHATLPEGIGFLFIAGFGPIVTNQKAGERLFYSDMLRLPLESIESYAGMLMAVTHTPFLRDEQ